MILPELWPVPGNDLQLGGKNDRDWSREIMPERQRVEAQNTPHRLTLLCHGRPRAGRRVEPRNGPASLRRKNEETPRPQFRLQVERPRFKANDIEAKKRKEF